MTPGRGGHPAKENCYSLNSNKPKQDVAWSLISFINHDRTPMVGLGEPIG